MYWSECWWGICYLAEAVKIMVIFFFNNEGTGYCHGNCGLYAFCIRKLDARLFPFQGV